jgi:hypothetical protein
MIDQSSTNKETNNPLEHETLTNFVPINKNLGLNRNENIPMKSLEEEIHEDAYFEEEVKKMNLGFYEKNISPFKLYLYLSGSYEILLMILGTFYALGAGVATPLRCYLFGDMENDFSQANIDENKLIYLKH